MQQGYVSLVVFTDNKKNPIRSLVIFPDQTSFSSPNVILVDTQFMQSIFNLVWLDENYPLMDYEKYTILNPAYLDPILKFIFDNQMHILSIYLPNDLKLIRMPWEPVDLDIIP